MPDFLFDGPNRLITEPSGVGDTVFNVARDLYSGWKRWVLDSSNAKFLPAFSIEGGTPIGSTGLFTGTTFVLINNWKIRGADHDHQVLVDGNLFSDDGVVSSPNPSFSVEVFVNSSVAAQGIATGSGVPADVQTKIDELWRLRGLDADNPVTVTEMSEIAGDVTLDISGDGETISTLTRQP